MTQTEPIDIKTAYRRQATEDRITMENLDTVSSPPAPESIAQTTPTPKPPVLYGLDVPYTAPVNMISGPGMDAAVRHLKGSGEAGMTSGQLAEAMGIMSASADNYTRKLCLAGLVTRTLTTHVGKGAAPYKYTWIPGREINLYSQEDEWRRTALEAVEKKTKARAESLAKQQAEYAQRVAFNKENAEKVKALKAAAAEKVKAAKAAAKAEQDAAIKALMAEAKGTSAQPTLPALDLVSQPGSANATGTATTDPVPAPVAAPVKRKGGLPPKGTK